jgi:L-arabinose isomerase
MAGMRTSIGKLRSRLGVVITTWSHEGGAAYAAGLVDLLPHIAPAKEVEVIVCPQLLEHERDIPGIAQFCAQQPLDALCLLPGNFTLDHIMPLLAEAVGLPALLWGLPTLEAWGALVAIQQTLFPFKELGLPYRFVTGRLEDERVWERALPYLRACALLQRMKGMRLGLMGWRAQGMSDVIFDEIVLRQKFGVQLVNVGMTRYARTFAAVSDIDVEAAWREISPAFDTTHLPADVARHGVRSYLTMKRLVAEEDLQAVTMECFHDHLGEPCLGFSTLNDEGIVAPCENDVLSAIVMKAGQLLSGEPAFHSDIIEADYEEDWAVFHHCGNMPQRLVAQDKRPLLRPIREDVGPGAKGPTIQATMGPRRITAANLVGGQHTLRMCALEGETLPYRTNLPGSGAKVAFLFNLGEALENLGNEGYGHHFALASGHVGRELDEWCALLDIPYVQPGSAG